MDTHSRTSPGPLARCWNLRPWRAHPLLRRSDRAIAWLVCCGLLLAALMIPVAATVAAHAHQAATVSATEAAVRLHPVQATLEQPAAIPNGFDGRPLTPVRWSEHGATHRAEVFVPAGYQRGETIEIWVDGDARPAQPPLGSSAILLDSILLGLLVWASVTSVSGVLVYAVTHRIRAGQLDRWATEWARVAAGRHP